jgi:outer membrane murein-binding lipoprotein Lpp
LIWNSSGIRLESSLRGRKAMTNSRDTKRIPGVILLLIGVVSLPVWGCSGQSHVKQLSAQQETTRRELATLRADVAAMQRDFQARLADIERQTRKVQEETITERQKAPTTRKLEADTEELRRAVDRYADKTKQILSSLIQAFAEVANEIHGESPSKGTEEPASPEGPGTEPRGR